MIETVSRDDVLDGNIPSYPYLMTHGSNTYVADTLKELIGVLLPSQCAYADLPEDEEGNGRASIVRWEAICATANDRQAELADRAKELGEFDETTLDEDMLTALFGDKARDDTPVPAEWPDEIGVPLVIVGDRFAPYTDMPLPEGNVVVLDSTNEMTFLTSLDDAGVIEFRTQDDEDEDDEEDF